MSAAVQTCTARADGYVRREPEATVLYQVVRDHWPRFLERAQEEGGLPRFVVRDFEEYLRCGVLEHGVVQLACSRCGHAMVVAFSCKRRGFCPSCLGRRMVDLAAHLVDDVLPEVPLRQWVCSLPWAMRCMLAFDRARCAPTCSTSSRPRWRAPCVAGPRASSLCEASTTRSWGRSQ
jgi:hypothetical protein